MVITWMQIFNNKKPCEFLTQVTEYVSPDMLLYDDKILHFGKCLLGWCSFQYYCCFTMSECHVPTTNNMPYYTMSVWHVEGCRCTQVRCTPPAHWTQYYRVVLHHVSFTCGRMQMYPGQMYSPPPSIEPSGTEPLLHHVSLTCGRMQAYPGQMYTPSSLNPVLQSCTTPCQFDMWKNTDVPRSEVAPNQT